jgi:hypothetical protein
LTAQLYIIALTIEEKLSSIKTIEEAFYATLVPEIPIERLISATAKAGVSLVLSLVTATISSISFSYVTKIHLSFKLNLTRTFRFRIIRFFSFILKALNLSPFIAMLLVVAIAVVVEERILYSFAIALAVKMLFLITICTIAPTL